MLEADIERIFRQEIEALGGLCWKWVSPGQGGVPDRIVFLPGHPAMFVELKKAGKNLDPLQKQQHLKMAEAGTRPLLIAGLGEVKRFFEFLGYTETVNKLSKRYGI